MNILEHINAGHYPVDDKGRALVPMRGHGAATICATDKPGACPIVAWNGDGAFEWDPYGRWRGNGSDSLYDLLPPPPRKVKVQYLAIVIKGSNEVLRIRDMNNPPAGVGACERLITLTGEYEEPWA